jgi:hypothetical protein
MTENNTQEAGARRWSVVPETPVYMEAEDWDWDDDDDEILPDIQDSSTHATPVENESSTLATPVDATDVRLVWKWVLTDKAFAARPDHGGLFHAQILEDLGVAPGDAVSGTLTLYESTIRYHAYDFAGNGIDDQTRRRLEREMLTWAEQGGPDAALKAFSAASPEADPRDDGRTAGD